MAEALEVVLSLCDAASGAEGSCTDWRKLTLLLMGVAKIADIAADWVVVVKLRPLAPGRDGQFQRDVDGEVRAADQRVVAGGLEGNVRRADSQLPS